MAPRRPTGVGENLEPEQPYKVRHSYSFLRKNKKLRALLAKYQPVFKDELGTKREERAEHFLKPDMNQRFLKARNVPSEFQKAFDAELVKIKQLGIISPVTTSEYDTPAVPVIKQHGSIRICGVYKTTVNPCLDVDPNLLPKLDDLFTALSRSKHFSNIDLEQAYKEVFKSESSKQYLTLNTQKGLFSVNRLAFGISSAPRIFQRIIGAMLKGLRWVCWYLDDILVAGKND
ncbi:hypothetical protein V5799_006036 [Amblyomma americanum]|uniref:Reverse transcriptase domain-containing protein n=1 Tax=Amblyomma americanum TaxID=6943 RepID=A0AAQ4DXJ3_AMBAM